MVGLRRYSMPETSTIKDAFEPRAKASGMTWEQWQEMLASRTHGRRLMTLEEMANVAVFIIFRQGAVGPLLSAEFEWSSARADKKEKRQALLLERTLANRPSDFVDQAQKDRAFDLLKVFLTRPEMGVFGGWENSRRGGVTSVDGLIARDSWIVEGYSRAMPDNLFPLLYLAAVRLGGGKGFDFAPRLFLPKNGALQLVR